MREDKIRGEEELKEVVEHYNRTKKAFLNLRERYGIAVPEMDLLVGKNEKGQTSMFTVVDRIHGENVWALEELPLEAEEKFDRFYEKMARYYLDIYREGGDYWTDFGINQLVYGRKKGEREDRVYIVDVGPFVFNYPGKERVKEVGGEGLQNSDLFRRFAGLMRAVRDTEDKFSPQRKLRRARETLGRIADSIDKDEVGYEEIAG